MVTFEQFLTDDIFSKRLKLRGVLVVYDPDHRYQDICAGMASDQCRVIYATKSSIESRDAAAEALMDLGRTSPPIDELVIYVPAKVPVTDEARQRDPFAVCGACGTVFPEGAGDEYLQLCLRHKPDHGAAIRKVFQQDPNPAFQVIDRIGGGDGWPILQELLNKRSATEILLILMAPGELHKNGLTDGNSWVGEAKSLVQSTLGLSLKTKAKNWKPISAEIWRFVLFSEFCLDLPVPLPDALSPVPHADDAARSVVNDLCDQLRNDLTRRDTYIERANEVQVALQLEKHCRPITDLGHRDTFPFEERTFLKVAVDAVRVRNLDQARVIADRHASSVWVSVGESQAQWNLVIAALDLIAACDDYGRQLSRHTTSLESLIGFYVNSLRDVDRLHREFEQTVSNTLEVQDALDQVIDFTRDQYRQLAGELQSIFSKHLETEGWSPASMLRNADVFDRLVAPKLKEKGRRVAFFMVDALRYELGVALKNQLSEDDEAIVTPACAYFPTITRVGMASLLPGAGQHLKLVKKNNNLAAVLGDAEVVTVPQRMKVFEQHYGDRFEQMWVKEFIQLKRDLPQHVDLLVLRSVLIDSLFENDAETAFSQVQQILNRIRVAINRLRKQGFEHVIIATDHGFYLNTHAEAGDVCTKPSGNWLNLHQRALLGDGSADRHNLVLDCDKVAVKGEFRQIASPRSMAPYSKGLKYFHGGLSLQETIVPVLEVTLRQQQQLGITRATVVLNYKNGAKRITTRLPVLEVRLQSVDIFSQHEEFEILLEAHDRKGEVVGEARPGGIVNPATGTVTLQPGDAIQVALKMLEEYEGKFTVKALDPKTLTVHCELKLETNYM